MLTNLQLAAFAIAAHIKQWVYWYGCYGNLCTQSRYESKRKQYPSHYTDARKAAYMKDIAEGRTCADCVGLIKAFFWSGGDIDAVPKYATNNCPDKSANGMFKLCTETGTISTIPDVPGLVVWKDGHIGVYVGNGETVEMKGFDYDCIKQPVTKGTWTHWGKLPESMIQYVREADAPSDVPDAPAEDSRCVLIFEGSKDELAAIQREHGGVLAEIIGTEDSNHV